MKTPKYAREFCIAGMATLAIGSLLLAALPAFAQTSDPSAVKIDGQSAAAARASETQIGPALDTPRV